MIRRTRVNGAVSTACAFVAAVVLGTASVAFPAASGGKDAWAEISTAFEKLRALPGYRVRQTAARGSTIVNSATLEVVPPDSMHVMGQLSPMTLFEAIVVGKEGRDRVIDHGVSTPWRCRHFDGASLLLDPESSQAAKTVTRGTDTIIDGTPVRAYSYAEISPTRLSRGRRDVWIGTKTGLPRRLRVMMASATMTQDFYDYGAKIAIILPACR